MSDRIVTVRVDGNRTWTAPVPDGITTCGELAALVAAKHDLQHGPFTLAAAGTARRLDDRLPRRVAEFDLTHASNVDGWEPAAPAPAPEADEPEADEPAPAAHPAPGGRRPRR